MWKLFFGATPICVVRKSAVQFTEISRCSSIHLQTLHGTPPVPFGSVRIANMNQQWWYNLAAETARHKSAGGTRTKRNTRRSSLSCLFQ